MDNLRLAEIRALIELSRSYVWIDCRRTLELAAEAVERSQMLDDPVVKSLANATHASLSLYLLGWQDHYAEICRDAVAIARNTGNSAILNNRLFFHTILETYGSNYRIACATADEGVRVAESVGDGYPLIGIRYFKTWSLLHLGGWGQAADLIDEGLGIAERNGNKPAYRFFISLKAFLHCEAMDNGESLALCEWVAPLAKQAKDIMSGCLFQIVSGNAYLKLRDYPKALESYDEILRWVEEESILIDWFFYFPLHYALGEYWLSQGDCAQARQHASRLCELAARPPERTYLALGHCLLARAAMAGQDWEEADHQASKAVSIVENAEVPLAAWRVHAMVAELESIRGRPLEAEKHLCAAGQVIRALADSLGPDNPLRTCLLGRQWINQID
jgi:tetratricopeptide (TPR) repeat protein